MSSDTEQKESNMDPSRHHAKFVMRYMYCRSDRHSIEFNTAHPSSKDWNPIWHRFEAYLEESRGLREPVPREPSDRNIAWQDWLPADGRVSSALPQERKDK